MQAERMVVVAMHVDERTYFSVIKHLILMTECYIYTRVLEMLGE
jgi:hypothetical protein